MLEQSLRKVRTRWIINAAGTRYVKVKEPPNAPKPIPQPTVHETFAPFINTDGNNGDLLLAALLAVRNLIRASEFYQSEHRAVTASGMPTDPHSGNAMRWNLIGAIACVCEGTLSDAMRRDVMHRIKTNLPQDYRASLMHWQQDNRASRHTCALHTCNMAISQRKKELYDHA